MAKTLRKKSVPATLPEPMPRRVEPCVATLVDQPPKGPEWAFEVKWDGYRLAVYVEPGEVRAITRGGYDWSKKFGSIVAEARELGHATMIIDGEAVVLDDHGRSDFGLLQRAVGRRPSSHDAAEIIFFAFDLLYLDGQDLRMMPLAERRQLLELIVSGKTGAIRFSEEVHAEGAEFFRVACEHGLEGIIAKKRDAPYRSGRRPEWLKIKCARRDTFVIVGYEPSTVPGAIGRLLLAAKKGTGLVYVGGVGTGWNAAISREMRKVLETLVTATPAVKLTRKRAVFTDPVLVADVEYRAWTEERKLRHPSFKGVAKRGQKTKVYELG
ncbi:non-homologous end-joining DNA ligase [Ensifer sp. YR511]|uniref:non-homologous end-joining DNA ligase n=1 Tax=Ensifer sp. YR511 TaxID=1855294 RepID=UPI00087E51C4|nr:non-homologous end-joining DNA ligase [Ensifer sp. YR511]SDN84229.1 bifunctional non-homologous end joining protein LigD [Ensifer sp. YR511]